MSVSLEMPTMASGRRSERTTAVREYRTMSVIVPVFNERATVAEIIRRMISVDVPVSLELIVVDDASTDGTDAILSALNVPNMTVVRHEQNRGKGAAVRTGLMSANGDIVLIQDADLEYDPADWPRLLFPVIAGTASVVYGSRFSGDCRNMSRLHWVGNRFLSFVTRVLYATALSDMNTCYKVFDRRVLDRISLEANRFDFDPEITAKVLRLGYEIHEVPVSYAARGVAEGKKITWRDGGSVLAALLRYRVVSPSP